MQLVAMAVKTQVLILNAFVFWCFKRNSNYVLYVSYDPNIIYFCIFIVSIKSENIFTCWPGEIF